MQRGKRLRLCKNLRPWWNFVALGVHENNSIVGYSVSSVVSWDGLWVSQMLVHQHCHPGFDVKMRWCVWCKPKHYCDLIMRSMTGKRSLQDWLHSASMVERAIAVCNLLTQRIGQSLRGITYPVWLQMQCGLSGDLWFQSLAKSVSG